MAPKATWTTHGNSQKFLEIMAKRPPLRGPDPPYAVSEDFHWIGDSQNLRKPDPPYADYPPYGVPRIYSTIAMPLEVHEPMHPRDAGTK